MKIFVWIVGALALLLTAGCQGEREQHGPSGGAYGGSESGYGGGPYSYPEYRPFQGYPNYGGYPYQP